MQLAQRTRHRSEKNINFISVVVISGRKCGKLVHVSLMMWWWYFSKNRSECSNGNNSDGGSGNGTIATTDVVDGGGEEKELVCFIVIENV